MEETSLFCEWMSPRGPWKRGGGLTPVGQRPKLPGEPLWVGWCGGVLPAELQVRGAQIGRQGSLEESQRHDKKRSSNYFQICRKDFLPKIKDSLLPSLEPRSLGASISLCQLIFIHSYLVTSKSSRIAGGEWGLVTGQEKKCLSLFFFLN